MSIPMRRVFAAKINDFDTTAVRKVEVDNTNYVIFKLGDHYYATSEECPHKGAPMEEGLVSEGRVVCPWHKASFDIATGEALEPPTLDGLTSIEVVVENDELYLLIPEGKKTPATVESEGEDSGGRCFVVLGAGAAGAAGIEAIRKAGYRGRLVLVTCEPRLPYDRTVLSKGYLAGKMDSAYTPLRDARFYADIGVEVLTSKCAKRVDPAEKCIDFSDGSHLHFDRLLVATGAAPVALETEGADLKNIFTLRSPSDAQKIADVCETAEKAVIVGSGFIGTEAAASLRTRGLDVDVVSLARQPLLGPLGPELGGLYREMHEAHGVRFHLERQVQRFEGQDGKVEAAVLDDGTRVEADLVLVAIGVRPACEMIEGVEKGEDGGIVVNENFEAIGHEGVVYAAGDVARFPYGSPGKKIRIEHWRTAMQMGQRAGTAMTGGTVEPLVPFFWTRQGDLNLQYVGHAEDWDAVHIEGKPEDRDFLVYYFKGEEVLAIAGVGRGDDISAALEAMRLGHMPSAGEVRSGLFTWPARVGV